MGICYKRMYARIWAVFVKKKKKKKTKKKRISNTRAVQTQISRHIAIIASDQALNHLEWYGIKLMANSVDNNNNNNNNSNNNNNEDFISSE